MFLNKSLTKYVVYYRAGNWQEMTPAMVELLWYYSKWLDDGNIYKYNPWKNINNV